MTWDHSEQSERQWDNVDRMFGAFVWLVFVGVMVAWLLSLTTDSFATFTEERQDEGVEAFQEVGEGTDASAEGRRVARPSGTGIKVGGAIASEYLQRPSDGNLRTLWAQRLTERREDETTVATVAEVAYVENATADTSVDEVTTTTVAPIAHWHPSDECSKVPDSGPITLGNNTMRWCSSVANHLAQFNWQPGDLFRFMLSMRCESNGDPSARNGSSGTAGLFQHRPIYWEQRRTLAGLGPDADPYDPHDNIHVAVWLVKTTQPFENAFNGCHARPEFQQTLRNGGL